MQLDLHGVKHENVSRLVDVFIWQSMQRNMKQALIITGNSNTMKDIVVKCLNDHGIIPEPFFEHSGSITFNL